MNHEFLQNLLDSLTRQSFAVGHLSREQDTLERQVISIAGTLGRIVKGRKQDIEILEPTPCHEANPRSLSAQFGQADFPWHSDAAHLAEPVRFMVLACLDCGENCASTHFAPWRENIDSIGTTEDVQAALFVVRNGRDSFYASLLDTDERYLRYDAGCMTPVNDAGQRIQDRLTQWSPTQQIELRWQPGVILVANNWNMLHRRGDASKSNQRRLIRCYAT